jgi:hypothetical protein
MRSVAWVVAAVALSSAAVVEAGPALAGPVYVVDFDETTAHALDAGSIRRNGPRAIVATVLSSRAESDYVISEVEYDCLAGGVRWLSIKHFSASGRAIGSDEGSGDWSFVRPGTKGRAKLEFVCQGSHAGAVQVEQDLEAFARGFIHRDWPSSSRD